MTTAGARGLALAQLEALQVAMQAANCQTAAAQLDGSHRAQRREQGAFYTPAPLVDFVTRLVLQPWLAGSAGASASSIPHDATEIDRMDPFSKEIPYDWSLKHR